MSEQRSYRRSRQSDRISATPDQQQSQRSPAPALSRTPTADRQLLRALTGTPENTDQIYEDETPDPNPTHLKAPKYPLPQRREQPQARREPEAAIPSRQSTQHSVQQGVAYGDRNSPSRTPQAASRTHLQISPSAENDVKGVSFVCTLASLLDLHRNKHAQQQSPGIVLKVDFLHMAKCK